MIFIRTLLRPNGSLAFKRNVEFHQFTSARSRGSALRRGFVFACAGTVLFFTVAAVKDWEEARRNQRLWNLPPFEW